MKPLPRSFTSFIRLLGVLAPPLAARIAYRLFWFLGEPAPVRPSDADVHSDANLSHLDIDGKRVAVYSWGSGDSVVLLVHGWRSRASRFSAVVRALESPDRTIIAFDAPGHGESTGTRTHLLEYVATIEQLSRQHGRFESIIGYSFGVLAAFTAKRRGFATDSIVAIAGPYNMATVFSTFVRAISLPRRAANRLRLRIDKEFRPIEKDVWRSFTSELEPTDIHTPLLVIHDEGDTEVGVEQATLIAESHTGDVELIVTNGLGHRRILTDPAVLEKIAAFTRASARSRSTAS